MLGFGALSEAAISDTPHAARAPIVLSIDSGVYILTGNAIVEKRTYRLVVASGAYVTTGNSLVLTYHQLGHYVLDIERGNYVLGGHAIILARSHVLNIVAGSYVLTGHPIFLVPHPTYKLSIDTGTYNITGHPLTRGYTLSLPTGLYNFTGNPLALTTVLIPVPPFAKLLARGDGPRIRVLSRMGPRSRTT